MPPTQEKPKQQPPPRKSRKAPPELQSSDCEVEGDRFSLRFVSHRDIPVVHIPHGVGDLEHDIGGVLLALEVVCRQQVAALAQVLSTAPTTSHHHRHYLHYTIFVISTVTSSQRPSTTMARTRLASSSSSSFPTTTTQQATTRRHSKLPQDDTARDGIIYPAQPRDTLPLPAVPAFGGHETCRPKRSR